MSYSVRYTRAAREDLVRLYRFLLERDLQVAERAIQAIRNNVAVLEKSPFTCRKADAKNPFLRELVIPFGSAGYVALSEVNDETTVTMLAVRHQLEDDYY